MVVLCYQSLSMQLFNRVSVKQLITALNIDPLGPGERERFLNEYLEAGAVAAPPGEHWHMPDTISPRDYKPILAGLVSRDLRPLVDAWIEAGRNPDGSEAPQKRDIHKADYRCVSAVHEYLEKCPPVFMTSADPSGFAVEIAQPCLSHWARDFFEAAVVEAKRLFLGLVASDWKNRLCKCRYQPCSQYFLLDKPRGSYRHGTFCCRQHQSLASAAKCTHERRRLCESKLIELAAGQLRRRRAGGPEWQQDKVRKNQLAEEVCKAISEARDPNLRAYRPVVKVNWITRNQQRIEQKRVDLIGATKPSSTRDR